MQIHGLIHQFPREIKTVIFAFVIVLSIGFYGGLRFVNNTTAMSSSGIETHYLGNENDVDAELMKFKKNEHEILTVIHNHIISMSVIFFLLSMILATTSLNKKWKYFLMVEPFLSIILTFGGIYLLWSGVIWFKYIVFFSGVLLIVSFVFATSLIIYQILFSKK